jgi:hypothetical protein
MGNNIHSERCVRAHQQSETSRSPAKVITWHRLGDDTPNKACMLRDHKSLAALPVVARPGCQGGDFVVETSENCKICWGPYAYGLLICCPRPQVVLTGGRHALLGHSSPSVVQLVFHPFSWTVLASFISYQPCSVCQRCAGIVWYGSHPPWRLLTANVAFPCPGSQVSMEPCDCMKVLQIPSTLQEHRQHCHAGYV